MEQQGLFYDPVRRPTPSERTTRQRPLATIPDTGWQPPTEFPNLVAARRIALDTETEDPGLQDGTGPGWGRGIGRVVGVSLCVDDAPPWYFPIDHDLGGNVDKEKCIQYLKDTLRYTRQPKVGANILYDVGWLGEYGIRVNGQLLDVQYAEALLDDWAMTYSLDSLGEKYLGRGKYDDTLYDWCARSYGGESTRKAQARNIHRAPVELVGPYAEEDARMPLEILDKQLPRLKEENLLDLFLFECRLTRLLIAMRRKGVRIDLERAEEARVHLAAKEQQHLNNIKAITGRELQIYAAADIAGAFDALGLSYEQTPTGKPSFTQGWLESHPHDLAKQIVAARRYNKAHTTFITNFLFDKEVNGRVHPSFHPLKGDDGGTVSGRFSSSAFNAQQLPSRDKELGPLIRGLFVPDYGHKEWIKIDYSQLEFRTLAHFAIGKGSQNIRDAYNANPNTDYHQATKELIAAQTGKELSRAHTKNINFGLAFSMGQVKLANMLGLTKVESEKLFSAYHKGVPFVQQTSRHYINFAKRQGYIATYLNRRSRFTRWTKPGKHGKPLTYKEAVRKFGEFNIERFGTHKALNRLIQGSAADLMKAAMLKCWEDGLFEATGVPLLTVHDELDFSNPGTPEAEEAFVEIIHAMETALDLKVPVIADQERGPDWGHVT